MIVHECLRAICDEITFLRPGINIIGQQFADQLYNLVLGLFASL